MVVDLRVSRGAFIVIKLLVEERTFLLLRKNARWRDLNLIGGHEKDRDNGSLLKTAQRELWRRCHSRGKLSVFVWRL